jgi:ribosome recycling factor
MDEILSNANVDYAKIIDHLKSEYSRLQVGRASAALVEHVQVESYGMRQPLKAVASISVPDAKTIQIQPWDKSQLSAIEKGIMASDIGLTPQNDGIVVRLNIPPLTEERRRELAKVVHKVAEEARIGVRNVRQKALDKAREKEKSKELTEDQMNTFQKKLQDKVDSVNIEIEKMAKNKEADVMTV